MNNRKFFVLASFLVLALFAFGGCGGGGDSCSGGGGDFPLTSSSFSNNGNLPINAGKANGNVSPKLSWNNVPSGTKSYAIEVVDISANNFVHWIAWDIPSDLTVLESGIKASEARFKQGLNDFGDDGYGGPQPPSGTHKYVFKVHALSVESLSSLTSSSKNSDLQKAMSGKTLATAQITGEYVAATTPEPNEVIVNIYMYGTYDDGILAYRSIDDVMIQNSNPLNNFSMIGDRVLIESPSGEEFILEVQDLSIQGTNVRRPSSVSFIAREMGDYKIKKIQRKSSKIIYEYYILSSYIESFPNVFSINSTTGESLLSMCGAAFYKYGTGAADANIPKNSFILTSRIKPLSEKIAPLYFDKYFEYVNNIVKPTTWW